MKRYWVGEECWEDGVTSPSGSAVGRSYCVTRGADRVGVAQRVRARHPLCQPYFISLVQLFQVGLVRLD